jgi:hypothetical protein
MADINGYATYMLADGGYGTLTNLKAKLAPLAPAVTYYYQMEGTDAVLTTHDTWVVQGAPDFTGQFYTGGLVTPLRFIRVIAQWPVS